MMYQLIPLHLQYDHGFGLTADAFKSLASESEPALKKRSFEPMHLPLNFLLRHAIELYLKGMIVTVQKRLGLPENCKESECFLKMKVGNKLVSVESEHSIKVLFDYFKNLMVDHKCMYVAFAKTDWTDIPESLEKNIEAIQSVDSDSTQFRYPRTNNRAFDISKSPMKRMSPKKVMEKANNPNVKPMMIMALKNDEEEIVDTYVLEDEPVKKITTTLKSVVEDLSGANFGIQCEFAEL